MCEESAGTDLEDRLEEGRKRISGKRTAVKERPLLYFPDDPCL